MSHLALLIVGYAAFVAEAAANTGDTAPRLLVVGSLLAALHVRGSAGIAWAAAFGFLDDCLTAGALGPGIAVHVVVAFGLRSIIGDDRPGLTTSVLASMAAAVVAIELVHVLRNLLTPIAEGPWMPEPFVFVWTVVAMFVAVAVARLVGSLSRGSDSSRHWSAA